MKNLANSFEKTDKVSLNFDQTISLTASGNKEGKMKIFDNKTYSFATSFTLVFCIVAALVLPVGYFVISYKYLMGIMETEAQINAHLVSGLISTNPVLWRYETVRIEELLARRPRSDIAENRRIFDTGNVLVAESINTLPSPLVTTSYEIMDIGKVVGRIEISRSIAPLLQQSGILSFFGLLFGLLLYRWLPFQEVIKTGKKLQDANDFLNKVMEGSTNSLIVIDLIGNIQMFNGRFEALAGLPREELLGHSFSGLFSGGSRFQVDEELHKVTTGMVVNSTFETILSRQDGLTLRLFFGAVPLLSDGVISGVIVSLDDITARFNAEEERLELERQFQQTQKLESLGVLAGGIAHDFNNILTIILGYCYVFKEEIDTKSPQADYLKKIEDAANRAADLCQQMLSYAGKNELKHSSTNMSSLVDEIVKMLQSGIKKNVTIELDLHGTELIMADSSQIQQIVMNLIINAAEAIGDKKGTIKISLHKAEIPAGHSDTDFTGKTIMAGKYVCLEVTDDGCGMDKDTQNRIFEPFYTTKFAGRGLGMSATLGIITSHGGALQLSSEAGVGTTFKVYLPLPALSDAAEKREDVCLTPIAQASGTILLVDDEEELLTLGRIRLSAIGFFPITATNGIEALAIYREQGEEIDLIILDLLMPEMDGIEAYRRLREISGTVPIVFCSGCSKEELPTDITEDIYTGFLKKPYKPEQMQNILFEMLISDDRL